MNDKVLTELYMKSSKHSQYQKIPKILEGFIDKTNLEVNSRYEEERWNYIKSNVDLKNKKCLEIGGNTGFFSFMCIDGGACYVDYYEGDRTHAEFVRRASELLAFDDRLYIYNKYYDFQIGEKKQYDICFFMNVAHHVGMDYDICADIEEAKDRIIYQINSISFNTEYMVFQLGFNWGGDRYKCLFEKGTKREMISFISDNCDKDWEVSNISVAERIYGGIRYTDLNDSNIKRDDSLGEFLNRPLFIMRSKHIRRNDDFSIS